MCNDLIGKLELGDPPLTNAFYTWSNFQEISICSRLDRFLVIVDWEDFFKPPRQVTIVRTVLNHCLMVLDSNTLKWGPTPFRFKNMWLDHKEFGEAFVGWWNNTHVNGWEGFKFIDKLKSIRDRLKK